MLVSGEIYVGEGNIDLAIRRLRRAVERSGVLRLVCLRERFPSKGERRKEKGRLSLKRTKQRERKRERSLSDG